ncbi:hypothetical protein DXG01_014874 [Tephrocybe rancida]|nr:hypothetical protein DXG01_014874 [Tephrocybe rancida]
MSSPNRRLIIDDTDERIRYDGPGWAEDTSGSQDSFGTYGATYNQTLHSTQYNSSVAFSFQGTSIRVYGTVFLTPPYNLSELIDPSFTPPWECFVNNKSIGALMPSPFHENNWLLCGDDSLPDGSHGLTMNITGMREGTTVWVDYIQYTPSNANVDEGGGVATVVVDSSDPKFTYDGTWQGIHTSGLADDTTAVRRVEMTNTSRAKLSFDFTGTRLTWVGYVPIEFPGNASSASYSIDNGPHTTFTLLGHQPFDGTSLYNQIFFTTPELAPGSHNLSVTYDGNASFTPLTLDYIYLTTTITTSPSGSSGGGPTPTGTPSHSGAIAGGVVGGVAVLALLVVFFIFWRRRGIPKEPATGVQPFEASAVMVEAGKVKMAFGRAVDVSPVIASVIEVNSHVVDDDTQPPRYSSG